MRKHLLSYLYGIAEGEGRLGGVGKMVDSVGAEFWVKRWVGEIAFVKIVEKIGPFGNLFVTLRQMSNNFARLSNANRNN